MGRIIQLLNTMGQKVQFKIYSENNKNMVVVISTHQMNINQINCSCEILFI